MATTGEKDEVQDFIVANLAQTPYVCSSLTRLSGGTANFIYRGTLSSTQSSIIIKHSKDYVASNPNFKLDTERAYFEESILKALGDLKPYTHNNIVVQSPRVLHFNRETNIQVHEDLPNSVDLKTYLLGKASKDASESYSRALGYSLGSWLRSFHNWGLETEQKETIEIILRNTAMKQLKFYINYPMLLETVDNFPEILKEHRSVLEQVRDLAAAELENETLDEMNGLIHGDFWTGNVLISSNLPEQSETKMFAIDWELTQIGHKALDLGQMIAELYETKLFKGVEHGIWIIEGFLEGYGSLSDEMAFRTAIHVGVHLICWGSRVSNWGTQNQVEDVVKVGKDLVLQAWARNKSWFEQDAMGCLFKN